MDENSQESNEKFNTILIQAQEQVENSDVNPDQIQSMVQQLIKVKSDSEARKTFKRNSGNTNTKSVKSTEFDDINEVFSSESDDENLKQSHRVPSNKRRRHDNERNSPSSSNTNIKSINMDLGNKHTSSSPPKERRIRKTKWNSPWEDQSNNTAPVLSIHQPAIEQPIPFPSIPPFIHHTSQESDNLRNNTNNNTRQFTSRNATQSIWQQNYTPMVNPMPMLPNTNVPPNILGNARLIMAQHGSSSVPSTSKVRTINIDGIPREIRFYDETAIAFMDTEFREPKEIGFQSGERRLCVDNNESIVLAFNDSYKPFIVNAKSYQIRFGSPTRELYIDNEWYECYFGDPPVGIVLDNKLHSFRIDGPAPQVRIGSLRDDLVAGKVDMYIDIITKVSLFLDGQVQMFQINDQMHTIQFADYFLTVLIDNIPFSVQYGSMPVKFQLDKSDHYIRFSVLPNDIVPGKIYIRNMVRTQLQRELITPPPAIVANATNSNNSVGNAAIASSIPATLPPVSGPIVPLMSIVPNPDIISTTSPNELNANTTSSQLTNVTNTMSTATSETSNPSTSNLPVNINDLYQKLLASGIINKTKEKEKQTPICLSKPETLKKRQTAIVNTLFSGMQCSSCGVRFPLEQTMKYSQHLDWHYRQNRRERDSARRAHSRKWYYDVSDWIQYEEIENLDEREKNWFETQQTDMDSANEESNQRTASPPPSCVAGANDHNKTCDICHDLFETFFHEETEEWHLRNAVRVDDNTYHPVCYEDYKVKLK